MQRKLLTSAVAALLLAVPLAAAHDLAGTPKLHCESGAEASTHDYGAPAAGGVLWGFADGNRDDCDGDGTPGDYDGHSEWGLGGAWMLAGEGDGVTSGSTACYGEPAHHALYGPFSVQDVVLGAGASFVVAADDLNPIGPDPITGADCGDFEADRGALCTGSCVVTFPPGLDGSYQVYVQGTAGHVDSPGGIGSPPSCSAEEECPILVVAIVFAIGVFAGVLGCIWHPDCG